ncbi:hypothetical protein IFVP177_C1320312 [Vibrio parahaemolyticus]
MLIGALKRFVPPSGLAHPFKCFTPSKAGRISLFWVSNSFKEPQGIALV